MSDPAALIAEVEQAIDDAERELAEMPFFVRPLVRRGFASRTGRSYDDWRKALERITALGRAERALAGDLDKLAENFRTAPERAARGPAGSSPTAMRVIEERAAARARAVVALRDWLIS
ncbi:MAG TPA: hypothetical protein VL463_32535 [Kofleriaceae bacterium]|jgi:hypothetical protein|nr:hypothetical protein [Kofleriaceae bacterium]